MKNTITKKLMILVAVCLAGCAKTPTTNYGHLTQMEFDAWIAVNKQAGWQETPLGCWITEVTDNPSGRAMGTLEEYPYMRIEYTISDLDGIISSTTDALVAQKIGTYDKTYYYGPQVNYRGSSSLYATTQKYLDNMTESTSALIYDIKVVDLIPDIDAWEKSFIKTTLGDELAKADSLADGVFYVCDKPADSEEDFTTGDEIYINYICRRMLDGKGVDTNIADSAKVFGTYKSTATYGPVLINWASEASEITMTSSKTSVVNGFSAALFHMHAHEKGRAYLTSTNAYSSSGSGNTIPGFCPLIFEIEFVDK